MRYAVADAAGVDCHIDFRAVPIFADQGTEAVVDDIHGQVDDLPAG